VARLAELDARWVLSLGPKDFAAVRRVFAWHPSEATGVLAAAAAGEQGAVETRDAATRVQINAVTRSVYAVPAGGLLERSPAADLLETRSLGAAARIVTDLTGTDELGYEAAKAARINEDKPLWNASEVDLRVIDRLADDARDRGATHVTLRRLAELAGVAGPEGFEALGRLLARQRPGNYLPSLYRVAPAPGGLRAVPNEGLRGG
jgi:hypothetical protein